MISSLNRRTLFASALIPILPITSRASQSGSTTETFEGRFIYDIVTLDGVKQVITMHAIIPEDEPYPDNVIYFLDGWAFTFESVDQAATCHTLITAAYEEWFTAEHGLDVSDVASISAADLPADAEGWIGTLTNPADPAEPPQQVAIITVVREVTVQMLIGVATTGSPVPELNDYLDITSPRWPDDREPERQLDGTQIGGLFEALPREEDFPERLQLMFTRDISYRF